ncbi:hypothetical protein HPT25_23360 [Bacillus sp. BRMEA1]|uniref:hypothetical protein n=1 Tax=Neobacillus endophyticus TaxID=2738405 RepID=UPI001564BADF|nr:hypothetical protein [Neobacillus endophyticus]NRD80264.1 hypothetical protein [Neobacillus endophyticus]
MNINEIKPADVLFVWGTGFIDDAIEFVTHGPSHCALFLDNETLVEAQAGRDTGTMNLSFYLNTNARLEVWRDETLTDEDRSKMVSYAKEHFGIHYDYLAILAELARFELNIPINSFHEGKRRICSSFVNDIAMSVGHNWSKVHYAPAPVDLINSGKLTKKGALSHGE